MGAVDDVLEVLAVRGGEHHGEVVDQRSHALQCAALARVSGAEDALVVAALLHDVGHLLSDADHRPGADLSLDDDHHEAVGARWTAVRFGPAVSRPIALHVLAKRYRCTVDPDYLQALSPASTLTLRAQGGLLDQDTVARFEAHPGFEDACRLREWDEAAKDPSAATAGIEALVPVLGRCVVRPG
ncbi:MAG: HD domain-containing protein [Acidimicrobiales bacterium]|jgi:predicted HD phosphohydrolase